MDGFARLIDLLAILQTAPSHTGEDLAARLGVTLRTLRRDIARLREAGIGIDATSGPYGGYQLVAGPRLPPLVLTDDEAIAVAVALRGTASHTVTGLDDVAANELLARIEQLMPPRLKERVADLRETTVNMLRTPAAPADAVTLTQLARAARERMRVTFTYVATSGDTTARDVEPYRLVQTSHCWYLVARDVDAAAWRTFRVDRITSSTSTTARFERTDPPDPAGLVTEAMAVGPYDCTATLTLPVAAHDALPHLPRSHGLVEPVDDKTSRVTVGFDDPRWMVRFVAGLPWDVEVVDPPWLRDVLADLGRRLLAQHAGSRPSASEQET